MGLVTRHNAFSKESAAICKAIDALKQTDVPDTNVGKLDGDLIDIDKAIEHYEGTLEILKSIDLEDKA